MLAAFLVPLMMRRAFSLVELSIVLVILGLLVGGILAGQSLIRASELRSVTAEYNRHVAAVHTFRDKYFNLPGDFREATRFWNFQGGTGCTSNAGLSVIASPGTCDGDGDSKVELAGGGNRSSENYQIWRHLILAGLMEGQLTGVVGSVNTYHDIPGENAPPSKLSNGGWRVQNRGVYGDAYLYTLNYGNYFDFGRIRSNASACNSGCSHFLDALLTPAEAWNIDTKLDDGKPAQGQVVAVLWNNACSAADDGNHSTTNLVASYRLSDQTARCALIFRNAF